MLILFADDDPILREFALVHLATAEVEVETVADGAAALDRLRGGGVDLLLVDLEMPNVDGFEVLRVVRSDPALQALPVMVITGREDVKAIDQAYRLGATTFLTKPINWHLLHYQAMFVHRAGLAESRPLPAADKRPGERAVFAAVERLADASVELLKVVEASGDRPLRDAAKGYRRAMAEVVRAAQPA